MNEFLCMMMNGVSILRIRVPVPFKVGTAQLLFYWERLDKRIDKTAIADHHSYTPLVCIILPDFYNPEKHLFLLPERARSNNPIHL